MLGLVFALCLKYMPRTYAENNIADNSMHSSEASEKFITIYDSATSDKKTVKSTAATVSELLSRLKISLSPTDSISPSLDTPIDADHFFINIYRSRPVLIIDGLTQKLVNVSSYDPRAIIRSAGFTLYDEDSVEPLTSTNFLEVGVSSVYEIIRGVGTTLTLEEDLNFSTETIRDYQLPVGSEEVRQLGELGKIRRVYSVKTVDGQEVERQLIEETVLRQPVTRIVAIGTAIINASPLTASMGRNRYTSKNLTGTLVERQETYYDLPMSGVMGFCGQSSYSVRSDGVKVDQDGYVIIAANLSRYPRCSIVETSLGLGKVYDTGSFATTNPEQFDIATDWSNRNGV